MVASLSKDLETITTNLAIKVFGRIPCFQDPALNAIEQEVPKRALDFNEHVSSIATAAGKKLGYLFRARKYLSSSKLLTLYKTQIRPSLGYCSHMLHIAAPTILSILNSAQTRARRFIDDSTLTCHLQPHSHRRAVGDLSLFYR
nr:unnamed protein product [Callosobruchus chinensis]